MKVVALISYKYDEDYLDDLKENIKDLADEVILRFDKKGDFWKDEGAYRLSMIRDAEKTGADYVLVIDPDERLEKAAPKKLKRRLKKYQGDKVLFELNFRELYDPTHYRVDGLWGKKKRIMIFPILPDNEYSSAKLHTPRHPINKDYRVIKTRLNVYHLKHIRADLRKNRREIYKKLDPALIYNPPGYDYLDDEKGMRLWPVSPGRSYVPKYREYKIDKALFDLAKSQAKPRD